MQIQQLRYLTASKLLIITLLCSTINFCQLEKVSHDKQSTVKEDGPLDASTTSDNVSRTEDAKNPAEAKDGNKSTTISLSKKDICIFFNLFIFFIFCALLRGLEP